MCHFQVPAVSKHTLWHFEAAYRRCRQVEDSPLHVATRPSRPRPLQSRYSFRRIDSENFRRSSFFGRLAPSQQIFRLGPLGERGWRRGSPFVLFPRSPCVTFEAGGRRMCTGWRKPVTWRTPSCPGRSPSSVCGHSPGPTGSEGRFSWAVGETASRTRLSPLKRLARFREPQRFSRASQSVSAAS